ncbi:MAG: hypothetical protein ACLFUQ_06270 [Candidatus Izemoplasmataceae bacterium]
MRSDSTSPDALAEALGDLEIDTARILINRVDGGIDQTEYIDFSDPQAIHVHRIDMSTEAPEIMDRQVLITPDWIYDTASMKKVTHEDPLDTTDSLKPLVGGFTTLYQENRFTHEEVVTIALRLEEPSLHRSGNLNVLKGRDTAVTDSPGGTNAMVEIRYSDNFLHELHFTLEYDKPSTKRESNTISGTHWYFGAERIASFPDLNAFEE